MPTLIRTWRSDPDSGDLRAEWRDHKDTRNSARASAWQSKNGMPDCYAESIALMLDGYRIFGTIHGGARPRS